MPSCTDQPAPAAAACRGVAPLHRRRPEPCQGRRRERTAGSRSSPANAAGGTVLMTTSLSGHWPMGTSATVMPARRAWATVSGRALLRTMKVTGGPRRGECGAPRSGRSRRCRRSSRRVASCSRRRRAPRRCRRHRCCGPSSRRPPDEGVGGSGVSRRAVTRVAAREATSLSGIVSESPRHWSSSPAKSVVEPRLVDLTRS